MSIAQLLYQLEAIARVNIHLQLRNLNKQLEEQNATLQQEIRSRKLAESALRLSEEKFAKAFRSSPIPITISTLSYQIRISNPLFSFLPLKSFCPLPWKGASIARKWQLRPTG